MSYVDHLQNDPNFLNVFFSRSFTQYNDETSQLDLFISFAISEQSVKILEYHSQAIFRRLFRNLEDLKILEGFVYSLLKTDSSDYFEGKKILLLISSILLIITLISLHYLSDWCCKFHFCLLLSKIYGIYHFLLWWCTALTIMNHFSLVFQFLSNSFLYIFSTFKNPIGVYHPCLISYGYNKSIPNQASLFHSKIHNDNTSISDRSIS